MFLCSSSKSLVIMEPFMTGARDLIVPTFSLANGNVFESTLDVEMLESKLVVESLRFSLVNISGSGVFSWSDALPR